MCEICGFLWCVPACPQYDEEADPMRVGRCRQCGGAVFARGTTLCAVCAEEADNDDNADNGEADGE